jgi:glycosyltransferase involved in cell wall biosynthesis
MHILFFSTMNGSPWGGSEELWYKTAVLALQQKHKVSVVFKYWGDKENDKIKELKSLGAAIIYRDKIDYLPRESKLYSKVRHRLKMHFNYSLPAKPSLEIETPYQNLIRDHIDVICFSQGGTFDLALSRKYDALIETIKVPYVIISQFNKDFGFSLNNLELAKAKAIINSAKRMFFVSKNNYKFAEHQLAANINNYAITANSLNIKNLSICDYPEQDDAVFVSIGRLDVLTKGVDLMIKCFSEPIWRNRQWQYLIYGDGPDKDYFKDLIQFYGLEDKVILCGFADDIRAVWTKGQILLQPSIAEGTPLTLQEAMYCGRTALVTDIAGNTELIKEGFNGFVAAGPIYNALLIALERAYQDKHLWQKFGENAHNTAMGKIKPNPEVDLLNTLLN